ncbi:MAG: hypothetical protein LBV34_21865 [Nocardiopsaceae bacterium]|nr:hypothetical protein [Nocardiopsaceae bacterium]
MTKPRDLASGISPPSTTRGPRRGQDGAAFERQITLIWVVVAVHRKNVGCAQNGGSGIETQVTVGNVTVAPAA